LFFSYSFTALISIEKQLFSLRFLFPVPGKLLFVLQGAEKESKWEDLSPIELKRCPRCVHQWYIPKHPQAKAFAIKIIEVKQKKALRLP